MVLWMVYTESLETAFVLNFLYHIPSASWPGVPPSTAADLVMPRMRAVASAYYILINTFIGLALGPYAMGQLSDLYAAGGMDSAESLRLAISTALLMLVVSLICLSVAWRYLPEDESSRLERARALGEPVAELD
jgi:MFS family permease